MPRKRTVLTKYKLPPQAFALVGDGRDTKTWLLPHHSKEVKRADEDETVDWRRTAAAAAKLSPGGRREGGLKTSPEEVLAAAAHLAGHYRRAGRRLPDILAVLT